MKRCGEKWKIENGGIGICVLLSLPSHYSAYRISLLTTEAHFECIDCLNVLCLSPPADMLILSKLHYVVNGMQILFQDLQFAQCTFYSMTLYQMADIYYLVFMCFITTCLLIPAIFGV